MIKILLTVLVMASGCATVQHAAAPAPRIILVKGPLVRLSASETLMASCTEPLCGLPSDLGN